jgi:chorismate mutase
MDNRINEIRRKISALRAEMAEIEAVVRDQVNHDMDCTADARRLMAMRAELAGLIGGWKAAGGSERLPSVRERKSAPRGTALRR